MRGRFLLLSLAVLTGGGCALSGVRLRQDDGEGVLSVRIQGREVLAWRYGPEWALPHIWPLRAPSGRSLLVQRTEPYPHHRSLWFADRVQLEGAPEVDFYHEWKNLRDPEHPERGHRHFIRHDRFSRIEQHRDRAAIVEEATWIVAETRPVLAQTTRLEVRDLGGGEYFLDLTWELRAEYGDVTFKSDWVHYAWPYLRMDPAYSGEHGGTLLDDQGRRGQEATNGRYARWVDYSNTVDGVTEGLAVFVPDDGRPRKWLTREYGTFGPRRPDPRSGTGFVLKRGESLPGHAGVLVHRGDAVEGRVAERYAALMAGGAGHASAGRSLRVAVCQVRCVDGDLEGNLQRVATAVEAAAALDADIACFPETTLLGWINPAAHELADPIPGPTSDRIAELARRHGLMISIGLCEKDGPRLHDSSILVGADGAVLGKHRKVNILEELMDPPYAPGAAADIGAVETPRGRVGLLICADVFQDELVARLAAAAPDLVLVPFGWAADPAEWPEHGKSLAAWVSSVADRVGAPVVGTDLVGEVSSGPWKGKTYGGQSVVADAGGGILGTLRDRGAEVRVFTLRLPAP